MSDETFDPRGAALRYAASVEAVADTAPGATRLERMCADAVHAVVCGLVYIGDEVRDRVDDKMREIADAAEGAEHGRRGD